MRILCLGTPAMSRRQSSTSSFCSPVIWWGRRKTWIQEKVQSSCLKGSRKKYLPHTTAEGLVQSSLPNQTTVAHIFTQQNLSNPPLIATCAGVFSPIITRCERKLRRSSSPLLGLSGPASHWETTSSIPKFLPSQLQTCTCSYPYSPVRSIPTALL